MKINPVRNINYTGLRVSLDDKSVDGFDYILEPPEKPIKGDKTKEELAVRLMELVYVANKKMKDDYVLRVSALSEVAGFLKVQIAKDLPYQPVVAETLIQMKQQYKTPQGHTVYPCTINLSYADRIAQIEKLESDALKAVNAKASANLYE